MRIRSLKACRRWVVAAGLVLAVGALASPARSGDTAALRAQIEAFVRARASSPPTRIVVPPLDDFAPPADAPERVELRMQVSPRARMSGSVPVTLVQLANGREIRRGTVTVRVETSQRVLVAAHRLPRGTLVRPDDVQARSMPASQVPPGAMDDVEQLVGLRTTRSLAAGSVWRSEFVRAAPRISRGDLVRMRLQHGALSIQTLGKARDEGRIGDRVRVLNLDSRREVVGVVGADGVVHVVF